MKTKGKCLLVFAILALLLIVPQVTHAQDDMAVAYVQVPDGWDSPHIWAWDDAGNNAFAAWPGGAAQPDPENPGWYFIWLPATKNNIIVSSGNMQTDDHALDGLPVWLTVISEDEVEISYEALTQGEPPAYVPTEVVPDTPPPAANNITVRAQVPYYWDTPHLWAWSHPAGTNAFAAWPGEPLTRDGEWYTIDAPDWVNSFIVNANDGAVQTGDMRELEVGRDIWILVVDADTYFYDYSEITEIPTIEEPPLPADEPEPEPEPDETDTPEEPEITGNDTDESNGSNTLIIIVVIAAVLVVAVIIVIVAKKRK